MSDIKSPFPGLDFDAVMEEASRLGTALLDDMRWQILYEESGAHLVPKGNPFCTVDIDLFKFLHFEDKKISPSENETYRRAALGRLFLEVKEAIRTRQLRDNTLSGKDVREATPLLSVLALLITKPGPEITQAIETIRAAEQSVYDETETEEE